MPLDRTLLDSDHAPTMDELKDYLHKHDWSAAQITDPEKRTDEHIAEIKEVKEYLDPVFEEVTKEMGLKSGSVYYHQADNPLMVMRNNVEDLVSDGVVKLINDPDTAATILEQFDPEDENIGEKADAFLHTAVTTMLNVMDYPKIVETVFSATDERDYSKLGRVNYRAKDHEDHWYHTDAGVEVVYVPDYSEYNDLPDLENETERKVLTKIVLEDFVKSLNETDQKILQMKMDGCTQREIANAVGYTNNGAVSKRMKFMKKRLLEMGIGA